MAAVELTLLGQRLEESARRHRMAIGATTSTSASNGAIGVEVTAERGAANNENDNVPADQNAQRGNVSDDGNGK
ncbi:hypothetical protein niasHT_012816 [Heterodera trifolii]|uniref:Uncharacterized protein n=1 Tax=Heterodera trifolii TaxID=157864 RepID=A0ABD2KWT3_9BILA